MLRARFCAGFGTASFVLSLFDMCKQKGRRMKSFLITVVFAVLAANPASAFERSQDKLFIDFPDLATEYSLGNETQVYAIADDYGEVVYVIIYNAKGNLQPLGTFACNERFEVLSTDSNGFYDIACTNNGAQAILRAIDSGEYRYAN